MADDSDSDEWGTEELVIPTSLNLPISAEDSEKSNDDDWLSDSCKRVSNDLSRSQKDVPREITPGKPMIIVDMTRIDATIHSKFDRNSVNDPLKASMLRKKIESQYKKYAEDSSLLADAVVIPCGSSVWRDALVRLRDERPGHYFSPVFP